MQRFKYFFLLLFPIVFIVSRVTSKSEVAPGSGVMIQDADLDEISGMAFSKKNKGMIWLHNDGLQFMKLFLVDLQGKTQAVFTSKSLTWDWEDLALDPGLVDGQSYLYAGDIGDNYGFRTSVTICKIPEPQLGDKPELDKVEKIYLQYPDGSRDAEAMLIDPVSKQLYLFSKRGKVTGVYAVPLQKMTGGKTIVMQKVGSISINSHNDRLLWITGASISPAGDQLLLRSYKNVYYWKIEKGRKLETVFSRDPVILSHTAEFQGEAIAFSTDSAAFYTLSEGEHVPLNPITP